MSNYKGQVYNWAGQAYQNDTFLPSQSEAFYLTVQEQQLPPPVVSTAGPTEYWTRPIEGQNTDWWSVSSNWLGTASAGLEGVWPNSLRYGRHVADGVGPETSHIMWTKPIQDGGVVGGTNTYVNGDVFYNGINYNARFRNPIIMYGRLFYDLPWGNSGTGGGFMAVDLRTGETLWYNPENASRGIPQLGQYINYQTPNQHGTIANGYLFTLNFAQAYDPATGQLTTFNITNVPSGTKDLGTIGEELRYGITNYGNTKTLTGKYGNGTPPMLLCKRVQVELTLEVSETQVMQSASTGTHLYQDSDWECRRQLLQQLSRMTYSLAEMELCQLTALTTS